MKNLRSGLLAAAIILVSAGSAFATNIAKQDSSSSTELGFRYDPSAPVEKCISTSTECTDNVGPACTWVDPSDSSVHHLYEFINQTTCGSMLYKVQ